MEARAVIIFEDTHNVPEVVYTPHNITVVLIFIMHYLRRFIMYEANFFTFLSPFYIFPSALIFIPAAIFSIPPPP